MPEADLPDSGSRPVLFRRNQYIAMLTPAVLVVGAIVGFVTGGTLTVFFGASALALAFLLLMMIPWRVLVFADEVEIRYILRPDRRVRRSEVTIVYQGKSFGGVLMFIGPRRTMFSVIMLTGPFEKRSATITQTLEEHGYKVGADMPPRR